MALAEMPDGFSRREAAGMTRLGWAFVISIIFHLLCYGIYEGGKRNHIWEKLHWAPNFLTDKKTEQAKKKNELALVREQEPPPLMFVDVSAAQAVQDAPKNAKYYSERSSVAANVKADRDTGVPKIEGKQTDIPKAADVPRNKVNKPQAGTPEVKPQQVTKQAAPAPPAPPAPKPAPQPPKSEPPAPKPEPQPAKPAPPAPKPEPLQPSKVVAEPLKPAPPARPPGELAMAKPAPAPQPAPAPAPDTTASPPATAPDSAESQPAPKPRPRTIEAALAQYGSDQLPGFKMKQDGGVRRESLDPGFDVAASPFGAYDRALIEAISQRWYSLLDAREYASDSRGKVVVEFCLHYDGRVTDVNIAQNSVGDMLGLICAKAISDPAPYAVWPADMRRQRGNFRYIQFTFFYY